MIKTIEIQGTKYFIGKLPAKKGRTILLKMMKILSFSLDSLKTGNLEKDIQDVSGLLISGFQRIVQNLDEKDFEYICDELANCTRYEEDLTGGKKITLELGSQFDEHFSGRYGAMIQWFGEALKFNFADFLDEMPKDLKLLIKELASKKSNTAKSS